MKSAEKIDNRVINSNWATKTVSSDKYDQLLNKNSSRNDMKTTAANSEFKLDVHDVKFNSGDNDHENDNDEKQYNNIENKVNKQYFDKHKNTQIQDLIKISTQKPKAGKDKGKSMSRAKSAGTFQIDEFLKRQDDFGRKIINEENRSIRENKNIVNNLNGCLGR